jgi:hypothetical protein
VARHSVFDHWFVLTEIPVCDVCSRDATEGCRRMHGPRRSLHASTPTAMGGESFLRVHWVAVPKALRARRLNKEAATLVLRRIDVDELRQGLAALGLQLSHSELRDIVTGFDADNDGTLGRDEFMQISCERAVSILGIIGSCWLRFTYVTPVLIKKYRGWKRRIRCLKTTDDDVAQAFRVRRPPCARMMGSGGQPIRG